MAVAGTAAAAVLAAFLVRAIAKAPPGTFDRLRSARPLPLLLGTALLWAGYLARGARLELLLPRAERIGVARGSALAGGATFLLQVVPFRGGEVASWALYRRELGGSWTRSGAVFVLVKLVDSAAILVVGLAGAAALALRGGHAALGRTTAGVVALGILALLLLPAAGSALLRRLAARLPEGSRRRRAAEDVEAGLRVAHEAPRSYLLALAGALTYLAIHLLGVRTVLSGLSIEVTAATLAFSTLTSVLTAAFIPSPTGTFGTAESGFAAALALEGIPVALGVAAGAVVHLALVVAAGGAGLPLILASGRKGAAAPPAAGPPPGKREGA